MLVIGGAVLGAVIGAFTAKRRKGSGADIAQYAAGYGIAFALLGVLATVIIQRALV